MLRTDGGGQAEDAAPHKTEDDHTVEAGKRVPSADVGRDAPEPPAMPKPVKDSGSGFGSFES